MRYIVLLKATELTPPMPPGLMEAIMNWEKRPPRPAHCSTMPASRRAAQARGSGSAAAI